jgi:hypothetical protein
MRAGLGPVADMHAVLQPGHIGPAGSDPASLLPGSAWSAHRRAVRLQDLARFRVMIVTAWAWARAWWRVTGGWSWVMR